MKQLRWVLLSLTIENAELDIKVIMLKHQSDKRPLHHCTNRTTVVIRLQPMLTQDASLQLDH